MPENKVQIVVEVDAKTGKAVIQQLGEEMTTVGRKGQQGFGQAASGADRLGTSLRPVIGLAGQLGATLSAAAVAKQAGDAVMAAARYETLGVAMEVVGRNAGYNRGQLDIQTAALQRNGIAMTESRSVLTRMAQAEIDLSKASGLARIAQDAAVIGNINSSEAFERMIQGIQTAQVEILRNIGINVSFEQSYRKLASQIGTTSDNLTESEKMQARVNAVMQAGTGIAGTYEAAMGTAGKQVLSLKRYTDDLSVSFGGAFNAAFADNVGQLTGQVKSMSAAVADPEFQQALRDTAMMLGTITRLGMQVAGAVPKALEMGTGGNLLAKSAATTRAWSKFLGSVGDAASGRIDPMTGLPAGLSNSQPDLYSGRNKMPLAMAAGTPRYSGTTIRDWSVENRGAKKEWEDLAARQERVAEWTQKTTTAQEKYTTAIKELELLYKSTDMSDETYRRARTKIQEELTSSTNKTGAAARQTAKEYAAAMAEYGKKTNLLGLDGLSKELAEIGQEADELRQKWGDRAWIDTWQTGEEQQAKAIDQTRKHKEEVTQLKQTVTAYRAAELVAMPEQERAVAQLADQYDDYRQAVVEAGSAGLISMETVFARLDQLDLREKLTGIEGATRGYNEALTAGLDEQGQALSRLKSQYDTHRQAVVAWGEAQIDAGNDAAEVMGRVFFALDQLDARQAVAAEELTWRTGELTEFQIQAFRNMESAGADFLASMRAGNDDYLASFIDMTVKMADQWLAAQLMMAAAGEDFGKGGKLGGWLGTAVSAIGTYFGSTGGITSAAAPGTSYVGSYDAMTGAQGAFSMGWTDTYAGPSYLLAGKRADGGPVSAGKMYEVNERGTPELLITGGKQFLMMGPTSGAVVPATLSTPSTSSAGAAAPIIHQTINIDARGAENGVEQRLRQAVEEGARKGYQLALADVRTRGPLYKGARV